MSSSPSSSADLELKENKTPISHSCWWLDKNDCTKPSKAWMTFVQKGIELGFTEQEMQMYEFTDFGMTMESRHNWAVLNRRKRVFAGFSVVPVVLSTLVDFDTGNPRVNVSTWLGNNLDGLQENNVLEWKQRFNMILVLTELLAEHMNKKMY
jgi:hypothetical protein